MRDPGFDGGRYLETGRSPDVGLAVARMMAHITYMSDEAFTERASRAPGVITELRWRTSGRTVGSSGSSRVAFPVVRFTAADGREVEREESPGAVFVR